MRKITIEEKWHQQSEAAKIEAQKLPHGKSAMLSSGRPASQKPPPRSINGCRRRDFNHQSRRRNL
jgi:hypothetical protein